MAAGIKTALITGANQGIGFDQVFGAALRARGSGRIVNLSSGWGAFDEGMYRACRGCQASTTAAAPVDSAAAPLYLNVFHYLKGRPGPAMSLAEPLQFKGVPGSPYTRKMLAYLRYRHIRYELLFGNQTDSRALPKAKVDLLPTFYLPNDSGALEAVVDSTPLIRRFEAEFSGRATIPDDPALAFLNYLIEDYADEWLTKAMFHYRWHFDADIRMAGRILPRWTNIQAPEAKLEQLGQYVSERQISRLYVVGSNEITAPVIEASYHRFLGIMDALIQHQPFLFGDRPASADFALYAQLTQLAKFDPTPAAICLEEAPRIYAWTDLVDDLSGHPGDAAAWMSLDTADVLTELLTEIGRVYVPALLANAQALQNGKQEMETEIDGQRWIQPVFPYQAKCLQWINAEYRQLEPEAARRVNDTLAGTGCEALILS